MAAHTRDARHYALEGRWNSFDHVDFRYVGQRGEFWETGRTVLVASYTFVACAPSILVYSRASCHLEQCSRMGQIDARSSHQCD